ncbi:hypothetical protein AWZ03_010553 [Drosophila navojoa]|uniref:LITAF domain-containing protein n=2 Tax=Drosophila navojoa TaxID=7232 RepID=A0A484B5B6_DRONA|nr:hypothetical protein AWZ03_010553 [Drosophila navojoa]
MLALDFPLSHLLFSAFVYNFALQSFCSVSIRTRCQQHAAACCSSLYFKLVSMVEELTPVYFAVGPNAREVTCPYCKVLAKTRVVRSWPHLCTKRHHCGACGEYLGVYRRPQL